MKIWVKYATCFQTRQEHWQKTKWSFRELVYMERNMGAPCLRLIIIQVYFFLYLGFTWDHYVIPACLKMWCSAIIYHANIVWNSLKGFICVILYCTDIMRKILVSIGSLSGTLVLIFLVYDKLVFYWTKRIGCHIIHLHIPLPVSWCSLGQSFSIRLH